MPNGTKKCFEQIRSSTDKERLSDWSSDEGGE